MGKREGTARGGAIAVGLWNLFGLPGLMDNAETWWRFMSTDGGRLVTILVGLGLIAVGVFWRQIGAVVSNKRKLHRPPDPPAPPLSRTLDLDGVDGFHGEGIYSEAVQVLRARDSNDVEVKEVRHVPPPQEAITEADTEPPDPAP